MGDIINFENTNIIHELENRMDDVAKLYVDIIFDIGFRMYGKNFFEVKEFRELVANTFTNSITKAMNER